MGAGRFWMTTTVVPLLSSGGYQKKLSASESVSIPTHPASPPALPVPEYFAFVYWGPTAYGDLRQAVRPAICMTLMLMCVLNEAQRLKIDPRYAEMLILGTALARRNCALRALTSRRKPSESYTLLQSG